MKRRSSNGPEARARRGFTLVEVIVCTVLVGVMMVASLSAAGTAARFRQSATDREFGDALATDLAEEIASKAYGTTTSGAIAGAIVSGARGALTTIDAFRSMWTALSRRFRHPKLRQLFGRYATYCGSSPFDAPATLNLVAYVEAAGVDRVRGGIAALRGALADLARSVGVEIRTGCDVVQVLVRGGRATGVVISGGEVHEATTVVWNGDVSSLARALRGPDAHRAPARTSIEKRSLSAVTWALVAKADGPLIHHNVFFSDDYPAEFESIEQDRLTPEAPTVYLCAQDRADTDEDRDEDRILLVVNAPASGDEPPCWTEPEVERCERNAIRTLTRCGLTLAATAKEVSTPLDFERRYPGTGGALYGPIARGPFSALTRQGAASKIAGLYLAGGSVHPGPGLPMAALSGRLAARRVRQDLER